MFSQIIINNIGKKLFPNKIFNFNFKDKIIKKYRKIYYQKFDYKISIFFFISSFFITLFFNIFYFDFIFDFLSITNIYFINFFIFFIFFIFQFILIYLFFFFIFLSYIEIQYKKIEDEIEIALPEFLDNLVSLLKGGILFQKTLLESVPKDKKLFVKEMIHLNSKLLLGDNIENVIKNFRKEMSSPIIKRTFFLIEQGLNGGGNFILALEKISQNLKTIFNLNENVKSSTAGFSIIINMITIFITPILFALSYTLLNFIGKLFNLISDSNENFSFIQQVPEEFKTSLIIFSIAMIFIITFFSFLIVAYLNNKKIYQVLLSIPFFIGISIILYFFFKNLLNGFLLGLI